MQSMKTLLLVLIIVLVAIPATAHAWGLGGALFDGDDFGFQGRTTFTLGGDISQLTTAATIYPGNNTWFAFDADYHFVINPESPSRFYPLVGLELATDFDNSELGANLGGGMDFMLTDVLAAYFEAKFVVSDADGFVATLGVKF